MPAVCFYSLPTASDNTHGSQDSSTSLWMIVESFELQESIWFPAIFCFRVLRTYHHLFLRKNFTSAIPAKFANLSALANRLISPISESNFAILVSLTLEMVFCVHLNPGRRSLMALSTSSNYVT